MRGEEQTFAFAISCVTREVKAVFFIRAKFHNPNASQLHDEITDRNQEEHMIGGIFIRAQDAAFLGKYLSFQYWVYRPPTRLPAT